MNWLWKWILPDKVFNQLKLSWLTQLTHVVLFENGIWWNQEDWVTFPATERAQWYKDMLSRRDLPHRHIWQRRYEHERNLAARTLSIGIRFAHDMERALMAEGRIGGSHVMGGIEDYIG
jgi:hypothetical protein